MRLSNKLLGQGYVKERLKSSLRKFYGRYGDLTKQYEVPLSRMLHDILDDDHIQWHPPLIGHYTKLQQSKVGLASYEVFLFSIHVIANHNRLASKPSACYLIRITTSVGLTYPLCNGDIGARWVDDKRQKCEPVQGWLLHRFNPALIKC